MRVHADKRTWSVHPLLLYGGGDVTHEQGGGGIIMRVEGDLGPLSSLYTLLRYLTHTRVLTPTKMGPLLTTEPKCDIHKKKEGLDGTRRLPSHNESGRDMPGLQRAEAGLEMG